MTYEQAYINQTEKLIDFYKGKKSPVKEYLIVCHNYIQELRNLDALELLNEIEYEKAFNQVLSLVHETYRPDHFNSVINGAKLPLLDSEFIIYILAVQKQLKKPIKWQLLIDLQYKYSMIRIKWLCKNGFNEDFESFAIKNITLNELFKLKI